MRIEELELEESEQPDSVEFSLVDGIAVKSGFFKRAGRVVPQHSHQYDHSTFIAAGSVAAWCEGEYLGDFVAPSSVLIRAGRKHTFKTLEDNTLIYCIHNIMRTGDIDLHELHEITFP